MEASTPPIEKHLQPPYQAKNVSGSPNIYIANGTCYYNNGYRADKSTIPCGNDYFGHVACCQASDTCLEKNACYNAQFGVTYIVGCTDPSYNATVCPNKYDDLNDLAWMGMSYCNGTSDTWVLCRQPDDPSTIESPAPCSCPSQTSERSMTLCAPSDIAATASLPSATGLEIMYVVGHYATSPPTASPSATASLSSTASAVVPLVAATPPALSTTTSSAAAAALTSSGLNTSAVLGIAVGATVVGILALGACLLVLRHLGHQRRMRRKSLLAADDNDTKHKAFVRKLDLGVTATRLDNVADEPASRAAFLRVLRRPRTGQLQSPPTVDAHCEI